MSRQGQKASSASPNSPSGPNQSPTANERTPRMADPIAQPAQDFMQALAELEQLLIDDGASPEEAVQTVKEIASPDPRTALRAPRITPQRPTDEYGLQRMPPL